MLFFSNLRDDIYFCILKIIKLYSRMRQLALFENEKINGSNQMTSKCDKCKNTLSTRFNSLGPNKGKFSLHCSICKSEFIQEIKNEPDNNYGLFGPAELMEGGIASLNVNKKK